MLDDGKKFEYRKRIGHGLAIAREELNLTQIEVGKTGIVRSNRLSQIELGKVSITTEEFLALSDLYQTTPDVVLGVGTGKSTNVYQYKINQNKNTAAADRLHEIFKLLRKTNKKARPRNKQIAACGFLACAVPVVPLGT